MSHRFNLLGASTAIALLAVWEIAVDTHLIDFDYLPAPSRIAQHVPDMIFHGEFWQLTAHTLVATVIGWLIGSVVGMALGLLLGLVRPAWVYSMASMDALRSLPVVAFVPVAVIIFGFSMNAEIVVSAYASIWPVMLNTMAGIRGTHPRLGEVARVLGMSQRTALVKLRLPAATAKIVVGLRLALGLALVLVLVTEMVGNPQGIGYALIRYSRSLQPEFMFVMIIAVGLLGVVLNSLLMAASRVLFPGPMAAAREG